MDLEQHLVNVRKKVNLAFVYLTEEAQRSVVEGSEITGAKGQPVQTGNLKGSWIPEFVSDTEWRISTNAVYARAIEAGVGPHGPLTLRSTVGGFGSVGDTKLGEDKLRAYAGAKAANSA